MGVVSTPLADACPILREAALQIADPQIRNLGTVGGNAADSYRTRLRGLQVLRNPGEQRVEGGADLLRGLPVERHPHMEA